MRKSLRWSTALFAVLMSMSAIGHAAVSATPMSQRISASVKGVSDDNLLPTITWGGDFHSTNATGNSNTTKPGSIFASHGLDITIKRQDNFKQQVENYVSGKTPYLRGTMGMILSAMDVINKDTRTKPIFFYKFTNSRGGDAFVVTPGINSINDLIKGKPGGKKYKVGLNFDGPHTYFFTKLIKDAGGKLSDVDVVWYRDLTGTSETPIQAFENGEIDGAFAIIPDALAATSGGDGCDLAECSIKGAKIMLSTKSADQVIMDVLAVRADYFNANKGTVQKLAHALLQSNEQVKQKFANKDSNSKQFNDMVRFGGQHLLDFADDIDGTVGLYSDAQHVGFPGQITFFGNNDLRSFDRVAKQIQENFVELGLLQKVHPVVHAHFDYNQLKAGLTNTKNVRIPKFDAKKVAQIIHKKAAEGALETDGALKFPVYFSTGQKTFDVAEQKANFNKALEWAATYSSAVITIEGHADPTRYLVTKYKHKLPEDATKKILQSAKNLSVQRADALRKALLEYAKSQKIYIDPSQVTVIGHGVTRPINGRYSNSNKCANGFAIGDPCPPKNPQQQAEERRIVFQIVPIEAESDVFVSF